MANFDEKVAIVTGAGRPKGIGAAVARRLAHDGAHVVVSDLCRPPSEMNNAGGGTWEALQALANEIETLGVRSLAVKMDVSSKPDVDNLIAETRRHFGRLDILVNNAGAAIGPAPVLHMAEEAWRRTIDINATGTFLCCQAALPLLMESGPGGRIINMSSLAAVKPRPYVSSYAASKAAIVALTKSIALEVAENGITVNALLPGDVDTDMKQWSLQLEAVITGQSYEEVFAAWEARIPVGRLASPDDVANYISFLASSEAAFITGQAINISGGRELV